MDYPSAVQLTDSFTLDLIDACADAKVNPQTIDFPEQTFNDYTLAPTFIELAAYDDSVDRAGVYSFGICGEKLITLGPDAPSFISITLGEDLMFDPFVIDLDTSVLTESDMRVYTVPYSVEFLDYPLKATFIETFILDLGGCTTIT